MAEHFKEVCESSWEVYVSTHAHRTLGAMKRNNPVFLSTHGDIVEMTKYMHDAGDRCVEHLRNDEGDSVKEAWNTLNEITLCQMILFNRRRQGEVSKMQVTEFEKRHTAKPDGMCVLSKLEMHLCKILQLVEIVGKRGSVVPVILTEKMIERVSLLLEKRAIVGVQSDNKFLFARSYYSSSGHIRGSDCLRKHANVCNASNPNLLRSTKLRKQVATSSQMLALSENQLNLLASFMGHDLRVHREYYQVPSTVLRVAKLSKLFISLEKGQLPSQQGRSLDSISFDDDPSGSPLTCCRNFVYF